MAEATRVEDEKINPVEFGFDSREFDFRGAHGSSACSRSAAGLQKIAVWPVTVIAEGQAKAASIAREANVPAIPAITASIGESFCQGSDNILRWTQ